MQPDEQKNYWQPDGADEAEIEAEQSPESSEIAGGLAQNQSDQQVIASSEAETGDISESSNEGGRLEPNDGGQQDSHAGHEKVVVSWEASEYIFREKDFLWFLSLLTVTLIFLALSILLLKSWTFSVLIVVMALALIIYSRRPPRVLRYVLGPEGLQIGQQIHSFGEFKAFGVVQDGPVYSVMLVPTKRFAPMMTIYFAEEDGEKIVDIFGHHLPMEPLKLDFVDTLMRKLRL